MRKINTLDTQTNMLMNSSL